MSGAHETASKSRSNEVWVEDMTPGSVASIARRGARLKIGHDAHDRIEVARRHVERISREKSAVYGINTGFGALANTRIPVDDRRELQHSLLRSHAAGVGDFIEPEIVRAMMAIRVKTLTMGYSGVRMELVEALSALLNSGVVPAVPEHGSLGASGDLAPLAHIGLCLCGEGWALEDGEAVPAAEMLARHDLAPFVLEEKEGLSLINGTDGMLAMLILALVDLELLLKTADLAAAMSVEAMFGTDRVFRDELHAIRPHPGQTTSAGNISRILAGSGIVSSHRASDHLVQDAYSLRCAPIVHGAARDTRSFAAEVANRELQSVMDNPVVLPDGRVESAGNFHGEPLAMPLDYLAIAASEVGVISERRIDRLMDPSRSQGLPAFLAPSPGVNSGFMISHYTAAALAEENRRLANPASTGSLPTSAMQEDHNSMGWSAGRKLRLVLTNLTRILAAELLCAAQALDLRDPLQPSPATQAALDTIRTIIPFAERDRFLAEDLRLMQDLIESGGPARVVEDTIGGLT